MGVLFHRLLSEELLALQLAQTASLKTAVRYIPQDANTKIIAAPIIAQFHKLVHLDLEVEFNPVGRIPLNPGGKLQCNVYEID